MFGYNILYCWPEGDPMKSKRITNLKIELLVTLTEFVWYYFLLRRADPSSRELYLVHVTKCDQVQQYPSTPTVSR